MLNFVLGGVVSLFVFAVVMAFISLIKEANKKCRVGTYKLGFIGTGLINKGDEYIATYTLREIEKIGDLSKVKIIGVSGVLSSNEREQVIDMLGEFIQTDKVKWETQ